MSSNFTYRIFYLLIFLLGTILGNAQNSQVQFGKNRVQFHDFDWFEYDTDNFRVYWAGDARNVGHAAIQMAEWDYREIQDILEHKVNGRISIIVYQDLTDLKQSNIGLEETFVNTGGQTKIVENKVFVYFNGDHQDLRRQVREGIAKVYINNMMFGTNVQEIVQNAVLLNLPAWYSEGLASYVGQTWSSDLDDELRGVFRSGKYDTFEELARENPKLAGHSLWYYIDVNYGRKAASNLIYLTRINRSVESGFLYVLGTPYGRAKKSWKEYFQERYTTGQPDFQFPSDSTLVEMKNKRELPISQSKLSPDGKSFAYVMNEDGKAKVYIQDVKTGEREMIFKNGSRNSIQATDYNYPLLAWSKDNQNLGIIYEKRDVIKFLQINKNSKEKVIQDFAPQYQRVFNFEYVNANKLVLTGAVRGFSDIFLYRINQRSTERITNDFYDDLDATYVNLDGQPGVLFSSNRGADSLLIPQKLDTIIPFGNYDIYFYPITESEDKQIIRVTDTPYANETQPQALDSTHYSYLSDENGITNRFTGKLEEYIAYYEKIILLKSGEEMIIPRDSVPDLETFPEIDSVFVRAIKKQRGDNFSSTSYPRNIKETNYSLRSGKMMETIAYQDGVRLYVSDIDPLQRKGLLNTPYRQQLVKQKVKEEKIEKEIKEKKEEPEEKPSTWEFESTYEEDKTEDIVEIQDTIPADTIPENKVVEEEIGFEFVTDYIEAKTTEPETPIEDEGIIDLDNYEFEGDFDTDVPDAAVIVENEDGRITLQSPSINFAKDNYLINDKKVHKFRTSKIRPHRLRFRSNSITTQVDNSLLFGGWEPYTGEVFNQPPLSILVKSSVEDLFEDYELEAGFRIPTTFNGLEYFATFKDKKKRIDKYYSYYRQSKKNTYEANQLIPTSTPGLPAPVVSPPGVVYNMKTVTNLVQTELRYPLDIFGSIRATASFRNDKRQFLSNDDATLDAIPEQTQRLGVKVEYVYDNTIEVDLNILNGTRMKVYSEVYQGMNVSLINDFQWKFNKGIMGIAGADIRHYQRLGKHSILALRATGATSFGSEKMLYFLGGVDNGILPKVNQNIPLPSVESGEFAFQTIAAPMRGFRTNIRNGNSFMLANVELRVPLFKYFYNRPIKSNIIRHFQVVGFFDVGTAWRGLSPFSDDNPLNTDVISTTPDLVTVTVNYFRDPVVAGFGGGLRTKIFGYFIKLDYARGIETKTLQSPRWHFSIGTDF